MKTIVIMAAASVLGALASPAVAQVQFGVGPDGPDIQVGPSREDRWERRNEWERRHEWRRRRAIDDGHDDWQRERLPHHHRSRAE